MNELTGASETVSAESETRHSSEAAESSGRHPPAAQDSFLTDDDALEAFLASEDRALEEALGKEDRALEAFLAKEDCAVEEALGKEDGALEAFLAKEEQSLEPSQDQEASGATGGGSPGWDPAASELAATGADGTEEPGAEPETIFFQGKPETVTYEGKDLKVTHDAADGVWIEGMPGDPPLKIGEVLSSTDEGEHSWLEGLCKEATREAEDLTDTGEKLADLIQKQFGSPPPTHTTTLHQAPENSAGGSEHGIDVGHGVDAVLALAVVGAAAAYKLREWCAGQRRNEGREAFDAGY